MSHRPKKHDRSVPEVPPPAIRTTVFEPPLARPRRLRPALVCLALVAAVIAIYARTGRYSFTDLADPAVVYDNPAVKDGISGSSIQWAFTSTRPFAWQPLTYLSHMLDCQVFGLDAGRHHLVSVGLHALNAVLLFLLLAYVTGCGWRSAFAAGLFALHPLRVESVAWIAERRDVLSGLFSLLALWAYVRYAERPNSWKRYAAVFVALWLALMSDPVAAALPLAMLLLDYWPLRRFEGRGAPKLIVEKIPLLASAAVCLAINMIGSFHGGAGLLGVLPFRLRIASAMAAYSGYLGKLVWPRSLAVFYPAVLPETKTLVIAAFVLVLLSAAAARARGARPYVFIGWLWFLLLLLLPVAGLARAGEPFLADRFTYLALIGPSIALVWLAGDWLESRPAMRRSGVAAGAAALAILGGLSWRQAGYWEDKFAVYRHAIRVTGQNDRVWFGYANALARDGAFEEAERVYREAIRLEPGNGEMREALGQVLLKQGRQEEAIDQYREAVRLAPESVAARKNLGLGLILAGRPQEAEIHLQAAARAAPDDPDIPRLLGLAGALHPVNASDQAAVDAGPVEAVETPRQVIEWRSLDTEQALELGAVLAFVAIALVWPAWGRHTFRRFEDRMARLARNPVRAMAAVALLPMAARLLLLPIYPIPEPLIADEFGHLLLADTFASGRLANPAHPMRDHFESIYVLQEPSYTSIYPIAQGVFLAAAKVLGVNPWFAVWVSVGLMCASIYWMLAGWIPPRWALLGALLAALRFSVLSHWMNTYWGGAVAAIGGALVFGAVPRLFRGGGARHAMLLGLGLIILAQTRPYEGFLAAVPVAIALSIWLVRTRTGAWKTRLVFMVIPLAAVLGWGALFTAYYDFRVTGKPLQLPYLLYQKLYGVPQSFYWQPPVPPGNSTRLPELEANYRWQLDLYNARESWRRLGEMAAMKLQSFWMFYLQPAWTLPLIALPLVWRDRRVRFLLFTLAFVLAGAALYALLLPHYLAPVCCIIVAVVVQCIRHMRQWKWRGRPIGASLARAVVILSATGLITAPAGADLLSGNLVYARTPRSRILHRLEERGGRHLIIVHYGPNHLFHIGWIYNDANIDDSPVVWARDLGPGKNAELIRYYPDRTVWLFNADSPEVHLAPYTTTLGVANAAGMAQR
ncbi:MAG TPA: tetratricopeptide repeat protein [Bryobacteraceae bacterium]|nr:tetratricopeptide repeat protein [Bryobacteraceae bacterium]